MDCQNLQQAFTDALTKVQEALKTELVQITKEAEEKTSKLNDDFKNGNDLAKGIGAASGTVIGGVFGGPGGAVAGGTLGKQIGSFFVIEFGTHQNKISFDLPSIQVNNQEWKFNLPSVTIKNSDIVFNLPTLVMQTVEGPPIWKTKVEMGTVCTPLPFGGEVCYDVPQVVGWWDKTYFDKPTWEDRQTTIVIGVPEITNVEQKIVLGVPEITMKTQELIFDLPTVKMTFIKDAGKQLSDSLMTIARETDENVAEKKLKMNGRIKAEVIDPANKMFDCFRSQISEQKDQLAQNFDPEIKKLTDAIFSLKANNVPETDNDYIAQKTQLDMQIANRNLSLSKFDEALNEFDTQRQKAINDLINS